MNLLDEVQQVALAVGEAPGDKRGFKHHRPTQGIRPQRKQATHSSGHEVNCRWTTVRFRLWSRYWRLIMRSTCVAVDFCVVRLSVIGP